MSGLSLYSINPRRRKKRRKSARRRGRMPAGLRRYWASRRAKRRATASPRRRRRRSRRASLPMVAPRRRRRAANVRRIRRRSRRINPRFSLGGLSVRGVLSNLAPAAIGGAGALGVDVALAYLPLPDQLKSGWLNTLTRVGAAFAVGIGVGMLTDKRKGQIATLGGLTVIAYDVIKGAVRDNFPDVKGTGGVADYQDYTVGAYMNGGGAPALPAPGTGAYMDPTMGYMNPAPLVDIPSGDDGVGDWQGWQSDGM